MPDEPRDEDLIREAQRLDRDRGSSYEQAFNQPMKQVKVENWEDMMRELREINTSLKNLVVVLSGREE